MSFFLKNPKNSSGSSEVYRVKKEMEKLEVEIHEKERNTTPYTILKPIKTKDLEFHRERKTGFLPFWIWILIPSK